MRLTSSQHILQAVLTKAQELTDLLLDETGGDLRQAWKLWEAVKKKRASLALTSQVGVHMNDIRGPTARFGDTSQIPPNLHLDNNPPPQPPNTGKSAQRPHKGGRTRK